MLLMFGVGLHFHVRDLREVGRIAIPGALVQSTVATLLGLGIGLAFGWPVGSGLVLGMALSVASTVVLMRGLEAHNLTDDARRPRRGRLADRRGHPDRARAGGDPGAGAGACVRDAGRPRAEPRRRRGARVRQAGGARGRGLRARLAPLAERARVRGAAAVARALHAHGPGDRDRDRRRRLGAVRRVDGARRVPRRHGRGPVAGQPPGRGRRAAAARRLRRAVLRVGRDAVRALVPAARAAAAAGGARHRPDRQAARRARGRRGARLLGAHGARRGARPRADRRVLVHPRRPGAPAGAALGPGLQPARRLRARLDRGESVPVRRARPARGRAAALGLALAAAQPRERGPLRGRERRDGRRRSPARRSRSRSSWATGPWAARSTRRCARRGRAPS